MIKYSSFSDRVFTCLRNSSLFSNPLEVTNEANSTVLAFVNVSSHFIDKQQQQ